MKDKTKVSSRLKNLNKSQVSQLTLGIDWYHREELHLKYLRKKKKGRIFKENVGEI